MTPDDVAVVPCSDWSALEPLIEAEREEMSLFGTITRDSLGRPELRRADRYRDQSDSGHLTYAMTCAGQMAGFALTRPVEGRTFIDAFWLAPELRGAGLGTAAALSLMHSRPGPWSLAFLEENVAAAALWRRAVSAVDGEAAVSSRTNGGTTFTWLEFEVSEAPAAAG